MDDLVLTGTLGLIGLCSAAIMLLYGVYLISALVVTSLITGKYGLVLVIVLGIFIAGSLYIGAGCWLHTRDRI